MIPVREANAIESWATCEVVIAGITYARCDLPTQRVLGDRVVCSHHQGYGAALPFTAADMRSRLA